MTPMLQDMGVGMIPWSPLARGFLTHPVTEKTHRTTNDPWMGVVGNAEDNGFIVTINERVEKVAKARGVSMAQVAIAWSLSKPFVTAPIIGSTSLEKLKDSTGECGRYTLERRSAATYIVFKRESTSSSPRRKLNPSMSLTSHGQFQVIFEHHESIVLPNDRVKCAPIQGFITRINQDCPQTISATHQGRCRQ